ncbi:hypothetical protein CC78DRAFT_588298 [Lojkania enalia]|uniref:MAT1-1-4 n=1 Tax=Lojkania enalia TaxID=147567 RepID=A0A9P4JZ19_9PLEO|nr:hypothetical protein CC78DRAFT_588298 [Didymosphaeria enalia]
MSNPLSAAGLVLATLILPAQDFISCLLAYTTVSDLRNSDVYCDGITAEKLSQPVYKRVMSTLIQIKDLLQDTDKLRKYYRLQQLLAVDISEPQISRREIKRQATLRASQTSAADAEALALAIVNEGRKGVQDLQRAVASTKPTASTNPSGTIPTSNLSPLAGVFIRGRPVVAAEHGPNTLLLHFVPVPDLYLNFGHFQILNLQNDAPERRSWAQFLGYPGYRSALVILEWRTYNRREVFGPLKQAL